MATIENGIDIITVNNSIYRKSDLLVEKTNDKIIFNDGKDEQSIAFSEVTKPVTADIEELFNTIKSYLDSGVITTPFDELLTAYRSSQFNFKPTWGASALRYKQSTTGTGASISEVSGEFNIESGTDLSGVSQLTTNQRGQYQAGTQGQFGAGVRIPVSPTGTQNLEWGYTDFQNGFTFGVDATGSYVSYYTGGTQTKVYQTDWNIDKVDGDGASGEILNYVDGVVTQIDFVWYGYGNIKYYVFIFDEPSGNFKKIPVHNLKIQESLSVIDPNQPISFKSDNGASSNTNIILYVGGHQFSIIDGYSVPQKRQASEYVSNFATATNTNWQPLIAIEKKTLFRGRNNSVNVHILDYEVLADGECNVRLTFGGVTSSLTYATPTGWDANETAVETKVTSGGAVLTASSAGNPISYGYCDSSNKGTFAIVDEFDLILGDDYEIILWIQRLIGTGTITVKHAHLSWLEEW